MTKAFHEKGGDLNGCYKSIDSDNFFVKFQNSQELDMNAWDWFLQPRPTALKTENFFDDSKKSLDSDFSESFYSTESESPASSQEMLSPTTFQLPNLDQIRASSQLITDKSDTFPRLAKPKIELENQIFPSTINNNLGNDTTFYHPYHIQSLPSSPSSNLLPFYYSAATDMTFRQ
ncbi:hypothetical protein G9A89_011548 [Geosiphon pyriformis]|nr:hypothetical protein G9A89_011548 [Geosiphon pyriformis]